MKLRLEKTQHTKKGKTLGVSESNQEIHWKSLKEDVSIHFTKCIGFQCNEIIDLQAVDFEKWLNFYNWSYFMHDQISRDFVVTEKF